MKTHQFKEHDSDRTPGATRLTTQWDDSSSGTRIWRSVIIPDAFPQNPFYEDEPQKPFYCQSELQSPTTIIHYIWAGRWVEYPLGRPLPEEIRNPTFPSDAEKRCAVAGRLHDRITEHFWESVKPKPKPQAEPTGQQQDDPPPPPPENCQLTPEKSKAIDARVERLRLEGQIQSAREKIERWKNK
jgi:hypothetical protein